jgi:hypothetical protein
MRTLLIEMAYINPTIWKILSAKTAERDTETLKLLKRKAARKTSLA